MIVDPQLSLCMIVRDEERHLPRCLASVACVCDEIIVVDTGSRDRTPEIARKFGAAVHSHPWPGDFAAARNVSLDLARGEWVMYLDADEELHADDQPKLRGLIEKSARRGAGDPEVEGYLFRFLNYVGRLEDGTVEVSAGLRLFRNRPEYRFTGALHEQVGEAILHHGHGALVDSGLRIRHYGYLDEVSAVKDKLERNLTIARAQVAEHPEVAFHRFNLGIEYHRLKRYEEALAEYGAAEGGLIKGAMWGSKLYKAMALALLNRHRCEEALAAAGRGLTIYPDYTDLVYLQGVAWLMQERMPKAVDAFRRCLAMGDAPVPPHAAADEGTGGHRSWFALGHAYEAAGHLVEAIEAYQMAYITGGNRLGPLRRIAAIVVPRESPEAVRTYFERYFDLSSPAHLLALADLLHLAGGPRLALPYLDQAEQAGAEAEAVSARRGLCHARLLVSG